MNKLTLISLVAVMAVGCSSPQRDGLHDAATVSEAPVMVNGDQQRMVAAESQTAETIPAVQERKVIKEGNIVFETNDLAKSRQHVEAVLNVHHGYIDAEQEYSSAGRVSQSLQVRVPIASFDKFLEDLSSGVDHFENKSINSRDVTTEYIDVAARVKTKKELEQRYLELLKKSNTIKDVLEIERELGNVRAEIESVEGQLRYLRDQTDYSTLSITYYKTTPARTSFGNKFSRGFVNGWNNLVWFLVGLVNIWPFVLIFAGLAFWFGFWIKRRRSRREKETMA